MNYPNLIIKSLMVNWKAVNVSMLGRLCAKLWLYVGQWTIVNFLWPLLSIDNFHSHLEPFHNKQRKLFRLGWKFKLCFLYLYKISCFMLWFLISHCYKSMNKIVHVSWISLRIYVYNKIEIVSRHVSWGQEEQFDERNRRWKISWHCPFKHSPKKQIPSREA